MGTYTLPSFAVLVDSNILFSKDPANIVSPKFREAWAEYRKHTKVTLYVPEVVRGERIFQLVAIARKSMANATENFQTLTHASGLVAPKFPTEAEIKKAVTDKFDRWLAQVKAVVMPVPHESINSPRIISNAIWREPPFSMPTDGKDTEKGFRDCLIFETLKHLRETSTADQVVFVSRDRLLRECASSHFDPKTVAAYEDIEGFGSYLKLTKENSDKAFVQSMLQKAPAVFYSAGDPKCVYNLFNIPARIAQESHGNANLNKEGMDDSAFLPTSQEKFFIDSTGFDKDLGNRAVQWRTRLRLVRLLSTKQKPAFERSSQDSSIWLEILSTVSSFLISQTVRVQQFDVYWSAKLSNSVNFTDLQVVNIKANSPTHEPGIFSAAKYGFPPPEIETAAKPVSEN